MKYLIGVLIAAAMVLTPTAALAAPKPAEGSPMLKAASTGLAGTAKLAGQPMCAEFSETVWAGETNRSPTVGRGDHNHNCELKPGHQGWGVAILQDALIHCYNQRIALDGKYGRETTDAVRNVQTFHGIRADGAYGWNTWIAMKFPWVNLATGAHAPCW